MLRAGWQVPNGHVYRGVGEDERVEGRHILQTVFLRKEAEETSLGHAASRAGANLSAHPSLLQPLCFRGSSLTAFLSADWIHWRDTGTV